MVKTEEVINDEEKRGIAWTVEHVHRKHPEAIFMTQTSSTLYGWAIKEAYKTAWPEERTPKIFTIDPRPFKYKTSKGGEREDLSEEEMYTHPPAQKVVEDVADKLKRHNIKGNIVIIDEICTQGDERPYSGGQCFPKKGTSLFNASRAVHTATVWAGSYNDIYDFVLGGGAGVRGAEGGPWKRKSRVLSVDYGRVNTPQERALAKKMILKYKQLGKEIGERVVEREAKFGKLEKTFGIASIFVFLFSVSSFSGITGNVIGVENSKNLLGVISLLVGLIFGGVYLFVKKKRELIK